MHQLWLRVLLSAVIGASIVGWRSTAHALVRLSHRQKWELLLHACLIYPVGALSWVAAVQYSPLVTVAFISPLPTEAVWGCLMFRESIRGLSLFFLLSAVLGLWWLCSPTSIGAGLGEGLALLSTFGFSLGVMLQTRANWTPKKLQSTTLVSFVGAGMIAGAGCWFPEPFPTDVSWMGCLVLVGSGALIAVNFLLLSFGFSRVDGMLAGVILMLEVPAAAGIGYFLLDEVVPADAVLGGVIILLAGMNLLFARAQSESESS